MRDRFPANIYLLIVKVNNKQRRQQRHSGAFIAKFEHILHLLKAIYQFFSSQ